MLVGMVERAWQPRLPRLTSRNGRNGRVTVAAAMLLGFVVALVPACGSTANISDVYTALDANGDRKRDTFYTDSKEIHCVVEAGIGRRGVTILTLVRQLQAYDFVADRFFDTNRVTANVESAPEPQDGIQKEDTTLSPSAPDGSQDQGAPFLPGHFQCEAYLDGTLERTVTFNVDFPPCPSATILPMGICYGFYKANAVCPRYGLTSTDKTTCRCDAAAGWACDG
jgi:hypothetical protein